MLDFAYSAGLRASEMVGATLGSIERDAHDDQWLHIVGKGSRAGKVALPPLARVALDGCRGRIWGRKGKFQRNLEDH